MAAKIAEKSGVAAVSHQIIATRLGMALGSVFRYFTTREALNQALYDYVLRRSGRYPRAYIEAKLATLEGVERQVFIELVTQLLEELEV